ncbi:SDR family NAD(P)-dependent oxidoreductase [Streptomyces sp. NPDC017405]|uniref:SDR family NAD(P)-dependent oxidoreductase n=1 Tax=unclassified Streptomyces TaxID=2593676 RepID=UPI0037ADBDE2
MSGDSPTVGLVTAASGGIGRAVAGELLARGVVDRLVAVDVAEPATPLPAGADFRRCDLRDTAGLAELVADLPAELSVLVNVLGGEQRPPVAPVTDVAWPPPEVWDDIIDLNVSAAYRLTRALAGRLVPGAAVCNVSSIAAAMPWAVSPAYGAAKAALEHWSSSLAVLLGPRAVRVNLVRPGFVWSRQWAAVDRAEFERVVADRVVLHEAPPYTSREQTAADIAAAVAFLCSPDARHVTGQAINVDGGATLVRAAR